MRRPLLKTRLCTAALLFFSLPLGAAPILRLVANHWEPYTGEALANHGLASLIVTTALQRAGYDADIVIVPWARALAMASRGDADGIVAIWSTDERRGKFLFSDSYASNDLVLLRMRGKFQDRKGWSDLSGLRIGIGREYDYSDDFLAKKNFDVAPVGRVMQNLQKLTVGRVDMVLEDKRIARYNISKYQKTEKLFSEIEFSESTVLKLPLYFCLNPNIPDAKKIVGKFNVEIEKMRRDGTLKKILLEADSGATPPAERK